LGKILFDLGKIKTLYPQTHSIYYGYDLPFSRYNQRYKFPIYMLFRFAFQSIANRFLQVRKAKRFEFAIAFPWK